MLSSSTLTQEGSKTFIMFAFHALFHLMHVEEFVILRGYILIIVLKVAEDVFKPVDEHVFSETTWCSIKHFHLCV